MDEARTMTQFAEERSFTERAKDVVRQGNRRHVIVEKGDHRVVYLPLTIVLLAALLAVWMVAILLVIAVLKGYSISVEPGTNETAVPPAQPEMPGAPPAPEGATEFPPD